MVRTILFILLLLPCWSLAQRITGTVYTSNGDLLPFASISVKGSTKGTSANDKAVFSIPVKPGKYIVVCQHIGYAAQEKEVIVLNDVEITFILEEVKLTMGEVIIQKGEDPAYAVIREAIRKRPFYNTQVNAFSSGLYTRDMVKLKRLPERIMGKKIKQESKDQMGLDTAGKGIIYLGESLSTIHLREPDDFRMEVHSSRVSGSNSFGISFPAIISLYSNNVKVFMDRLNPRGFISPIADGAISFYRYKYLGTFFENGKMIHSIRLTPRRSFEPLFSGMINITDDDWRIHSFDLMLTKTSQLELLDTLSIRQQHSPVNNEVWRVKDQLLSFDFSILGVKAEGIFLNVFSDYKLDPVFSRNFFDKFIMKYDTAAHKRSVTYWDSIRPVPLDSSQVKDYKLKDSLFHGMMDSLRSPAYRDSVNRVRNKVKPLEFFWGGINNNYITPKGSFRWRSRALLTQAEYNSVEGVVVKFANDFTWRRGKRSTSLEPVLRYGFSNNHFNPAMKLSFERTGSTGSVRSIEFSGGRRVQQFNRDSKITPLVNAFSTVLYGKNYMKIYEAGFGAVSWNLKRDNGLRLTAAVEYEDRRALENTSDFTFSKKDTIHLTPNYPFELIPGPFVPHQALSVRLAAYWQPGQKYIQFPNFKMPVGSDYPVFSAEFIKGIRGLLGSDVDFDRWKVGVEGKRNLKLAGTINYRGGVGGFLNSDSVPVMDFQHFNGNQLKAASEYVNSFQLAPYYANSTTAGFYSIAHFEHHLNGLLTNKIPLFRRLNWTLVNGANAFYVNRENNYIEVFAGLENIFKVFRIDFVAAYRNGTQGATGFRLGAGGALGAGIKSNSSESIEISF